MKLLSFFLPQKIVTLNSSINSRIEVIEQFGKKSIRVQNLEQSGPMVEKIWETGIRHCNNVTMKQCNHVLILGLGGGSAVKVINKYFPRAKILGIEIDPVMIKLGKNHLNIAKYKNLEIKITDAFKWLSSFQLDGLGHFTKYDLILVDLFLGRETPLRMESEQFFKMVKQLLANQGVVIFNRLRGKNEKTQFKRFLDKLKKVYHHIKVVKPIANYLVICQ